MGTSDASDWSVSSDLKTKEAALKIKQITDDDDTHINTHAYTHTNTRTHEHKTAAVLSE